MKICVQEGSTILLITFYVTSSSMKEETILNNVKKRIGRSCTEYILTTAACIPRAIATPNRHALNQPDCYFQQVHSQSLRAHLRRLKAKAR